MDEQTMQGQAMHEPRAEHAVGPAMSPRAIAELLDRAEAEFLAESNDIELMASTAELQREEMGEVDSAGQHPADVASETVEREIAYGIRLENLLLVQPATLADARKPFLRFETLTLAPFDRRLIEPALLAPAERA